MRLRNINPSSRLELACYQTPHTMFLHRTPFSKFPLKTQVIKIPRILGPRAYSSPLPGHSQDPIPSPPPAPKGTPPEGLNIPPEHFPQIDFPWLCGSDASRIKQYPYQMDQPLSFVKSIVPTSICRAVSQWIAIGEIQAYSTREYFPREFLAGAKMTVGPLCASLSKWDKGYLNDTLSADLYDRYDKELSELERKGYTLNIEIPKIHNIKLGDIWITRGPKKAFGLKEKYRIYQWMTMKIAISKQTLSSFERSFVQDLHQGLYAKVNVVFDADVLYQIKRDGEPFKTDLSRRPLVISFETPYFEPSDAMAKPWLPDHNIPDWRWRICDVDDLLESERLENRKRNEKINEATND
ncbi:hypothetical protein K7432_006902 [Basidiobolus ranarum]|uniref:Uncharacterized protein n=1 Tax=Basidiobolus ranarum TaxID=34480 RepID=A0ABR2W0Y7_9FUNG